MVNKAKKTNSFSSVISYVGQVRQEGRKVVWPSWRETIVTTGLVGVFVVIVGIFFFFVDWFAANATQFLLNLGS